MTGVDNGSDALSAEQRAALEDRLAEVRAELEDLARDLLRRPGGGWGSARARSERLEAEADAIRAKFGMPVALGRSSRESWTGWAALSGALAMIALGVWYFAR